MGGYVLAGELHRHQGDHAAAFAAYERLMRPYVEKGQDVSKLASRLTNSQSQLGVALLRTAYRVGPRRASGS